MKKTIFTVVFILFLTGCATTIPNIASVNDLNGKKLLTGRFIFSVDDKLVVPTEVPKHTNYNREPVSPEEAEIAKTKEETKVNSKFTILFETESGKTKKVMPDLEGYVYVPVDTGKYYIKRVKHHSFWYGTHSFRATNSGIKIQPSDAVVNFGTIKVEYNRSVASKATGILISAFILIDPVPTHIRIVQVPDWKESHSFVSSKFNILPKLIRNETVRFSKELEAPFK